MDKVVLELSNEYIGWISDLLSRGLMEHQTSYGKMIPVPQEVIDCIEKLKENENE